MQSDSYVTKRQSIKLLGEILLDRTNYNVMTEYVDSGDHLKTCMTLLRDDRKMVQYEGFHVFKVCREAPSHIYNLLTSGVGVCRQPKQVSSSAKNSNQQPRSITQIPPKISRGPHRR
jgi:hypothetical protein